ncbi:MAG: hypothetical protein NDI94_03605 [Candidatus Woesearchaeota archaeon]|nr:hypothetical protein [Candidatus Woesearchaeota archaeon]
MSNFQQDLKRFWNLKTAMLLLIFLVISFMWFRYIAALILMAIFAPIAFLTVRYSKMIPNVSAESFTSSAILLGYMFGPVPGFFFGWIVGTFAYVGNSFVSATYLSNPIIAGIGGIIAGILSKMHVPFANTFFIVIVIRTLIAYPWFGLLGISPFERFTHQASQFFSNLIIYLPLMSALYEFLSKII